MGTTIIKPCALHSGAAYDLGNGEYGQVMGRWRASDGMFCPVCILQKRDNLGRPVILSRDGAKPIRKWQMAFDCGHKSSLKLDSGPDEGEPLWSERSQEENS